jgi:hypothetical protein
MSDRTDGPDAEPGLTPVAAFALLDDPDTVEQGRRAPDRLVLEPPYR